MTSTEAYGVSQWLLERGTISRDQLRVALQEQAHRPLPLHRLLVDLGFLSEAALAEALEASQEVHPVDLSSALPDADALALLSKDIALRFKAFPFAYQASQRLLHLAVVDPNDVLALDQLRSRAGRDVRIEAWLAREADIFAAIDRYYGHQLAIDDILDELQTGAPPATIRPSDEYAHPIVRLVDALLIDAVKREASDIHFEPEAGFLRIRHRVDGILHSVQVLHRSHWPAMAGRLKVVTGMNIAESRSPQDGRLSMQIGGRPVDFRASTQPTLHGENIVLRILDRHKGIVPLERLGLAPRQLETLTTMIGRPEGLLLVTGPTGSGKTTTLYALLSHLNTEGVNIMTLEDPVEYPLPLIRQTSLTDAAKLDFASGIRALLRQDPDILLVGEIRDGETAEMAFRAAMTGHQVFATLHANSAIGALPRLRDLGIGTAVLEGNLIGIVAQRLVRTLCPHCKAAYRPDPDEARRATLPTDALLYRAFGCEACRGLGYRGRTAIMELLRFTPELDDLAARDGSSQSILRLALDQGFRPLAAEGLELVRNGITSLAELARVVDLTHAH